MFEFREVAAPYPGLRPFEPHESAIFFGRDGHTDRLLEILQRERFLAVIGPSGCGKSSLVRAGLLPGLAAGDLGTGSAWRLAVLRPGGQPVLALAQALLSPYALGPELAQQPAAEGEEPGAEAALLAAELRLGPARLPKLAQTAAARRKAPCNLLVLVDQFEEVFTYPQAEGDNEAEAFVDLLLAARDQAEARVHVVLTMRTDFLGQCVRFLDLPEAINHAQYLTPRLSPEEMEEAVAGPARVFGGSVAEGLAAELVAAIRHDSDQLPILQHALARMWRLAAEANPDAPLLDAACEEAVGGVAEALNRHAEEVWKDLKPEQQAAAEALFRAITERREHGGQDVRRPQSLKTVAEWSGLALDDLKAVVRVFADPEVSFLHHGRVLDENSVIDLSHEALIRQWGRLREWVEDEARRGQGYRRWADRAAEGGLISGGELARALDWWNPGLEAPEAVDPETPPPAGAGGGLFRPTPRWAGRYSPLTGAALEQEFAALRQFLIDSREHGQRERERLARGLFDSQLTHASLLARVEDYAEARRVLGASLELDADIPPSRRHARNLLAGVVDMLGGRAERVYEGAGAALSGGVAVSPDGKLLAAAGERGTLVLFDAESGKLLRRLEGHDPAEDNFAGVNAIAIDPQGRWLYSGGNDGRLIRWSLPKGGKLGEWPASGAVVALALSRDGKTLASGSEDGVISLWAVPEGKLLRRLSGHTDAIGDSTKGLVFSADGTKLASASFDKTARLWDLASGKTLHVLDWHNEPVMGVAFSPDDRLLATSSYDKRIVLWDAQSGRRLRVLTGHQNMVLGLAFSADGRQLFSASRDNTLRLWDVASGVAVRVYQGHEAGLWSVALHDDWIYTAANDGTLRRWPRATPRQWLWETGGSPQAAAVSPDGTALALGLGDGGLRLYSLPAGGLLAEQKDAHSEGGINRIAWNREGSLLATAGMDGQAKLWRRAGRELRLLHTLAGHTDAVYALAFSPDGSRIATASYDGQIGVFEVASGQGRLFPAHEGQVGSVAFSPDGKQVLSAGYEDRRLRLWTLDPPGQQPRDIGLAQDFLLWASFSPDGREIAAVGRGSNVSLYPPDPPAAPRRLVGHEQTVYRAVYSPDGKQLATVSSDMTLRLWDLESQRALAVLRLPTQREHGVPLWDFDFRCLPGGECWLAVPLTVGRVALYRLPYEHPPAP